MSPATETKVRRPGTDGEDDEPMAMTFPHLLVREAVAFLALTLVLCLVSLAVDAPLEEMANPRRTPNPAKAPWYFLGLQELLHYYPPVISGVLLPLLVIGALAVIPYFQVNLRQRPLWGRQRRRQLDILAAVTTGLTAVLLFTGAHVVWPMLVPLWMVAVLMAGGAFGRELGRPGRWLRRRNLPFWIFIYFLLCAVGLTVIGVYFRGPGWSFTLPWRDGVF